MTPGVQCGVGNQHCCNANAACGNGDPCITWTHCHNQGGIRGESCGTPGQGPPKACCGPGHAGQVICDEGQNCIPRMTCSALHPPRVIGRDCSGDGNKVCCTMLPGGGGGGDEDDGGGVVVGGGGGDGGEGGPCDNFDINFAQVIDVAIPGEVCHDTTTGCAKTCRVIKERRWLNMTSVICQTANVTLTCGTSCANDCGSMTWQDVPGQGCHDTLPNQCGKVCKKQQKKVCGSGMTQIDCGTTRMTTCNVSTCCDIAPNCQTACTLNTAACCAGGTCGNNTVETGEQCDPPGTGTCPVSGQYCNAQCQCVIRCGNGLLDTGEQCDASAIGGMAACTAGQTCTGCQCTSTTCRNGTVDVGEECDGGAGVNWNQATADAQCVFLYPTRSGVTCYANTCRCSPAPTVCGNGTREGTEECDDGNTLSCDGCNADCKTSRYDRTTKKTDNSNSCIVYCSTGATGSDTGKQCIAVEGVSAQWNYDATANKCYCKDGFCQSCTCGSLTGNPCPTTIVEST